MSATVVGGRDLTPVALVVESSHPRSPNRDRAATTDPTAATTRAMAAYIKVPGRSLGMLSITREVYVGQT
jgi:hypothetical protein